MASILLCDGNDGMRRTLFRVLSEAGHAADVVGTVAEAEDCLSLRPVELLIVSDELGVDAAVRLLELARERRTDVMRLLLVSGTASELSGWALGSGLVHRTLGRPFQAERLQEEVRSMLETAEHVRRAMQGRPESAADDRSFQECLDSNLLTLAGQPITRAGGGLVAVEFLLRSTHPRLSGPLAVLDAVERCGRVLELGRVVNRLAAERAKELDPNLTLFVNTHPAQFADPDLLQSFAPLFPLASRVVLEITERAPLADYLGAERALSDLVALGFRIAVDDIGSGYNSLSVLAELSPAFVKADMSIIRGVNLEPRKQRLLQLLASFSAATNAELIAEGIETEEEHDEVVRCGAHLLQGYFIGRPVGAAPH